MRVLEGRSEDVVYRHGIAVLLKEAAGDRAEKQEKEVDVWQ
jgi:hypothetical protein